MNISGSLILYQNSSHHARIYFEIKLRNLFWFEIQWTWGGATKIPRITWGYKIRRTGWEGISKQNWRVLGKGQFYTKIPRTTQGIYFETKLGAPILKQNWEGPVGTYFGLKFIWTWGAPILFQNSSHRVGIQNWEGPVGTYFGSKFNGPGAGAS